YASAAISNHVEWTHNWICSHWQTRGKRFKQHEAKGVGQTWEHEYVRTRVGGGKPLVAHFADEMRSGEARLKLPPRRSVRASGQFGWLRALGMRVPGRSCRSVRRPVDWTKQRASQHIGASGRDHGRHDQRQHEIEPTLGEGPVIDLNGSLEPGHVSRPLAAPDLRHAGELASCD